MVTFISVSDLAPFADINAEKAAAMLEDATAQAMLVAPCLETSTLTANQILAVRAILRSAILRWNEAGTGASVQQSAGPFAATIDTRQARRDMFWPSEIERLQGICSATDSGKAFSIDTLPSEVVSPTLLDFWKDHEYF